jgi:colanic acid/amylovoran biosynthesis protein
MNILIVNVHSALNLGDEAIMASTLDTLRRDFPQASIRIAANDPASWQTVSGVQVIPSLCSWVGDCRLGIFRQTLGRMPIVAFFLVLAGLLYRAFHIRLRLGAPEKNALLDAYYNADLVLSCGGGNFYAHHPLSPAYFWALAALAFPVLCGKITCMLPQSVGPVVGAFQRTAAAFVFRSVTCLLVREQKSYEFLKRDLKLEREIPVLPDLAFGLPCISAPQGNTSPAETHPLRIGVTVMDRGAQDRQFSRQQDYEDALVATLLRLRRSQPVEITFFVQVYGPSPQHDDRIATRRVFEGVSQLIPEATKLREGYQSADELRRAYGGMDLLLGTRLHTAILAMSASVPAVLIGYQPKSYGTMQLMGQEMFCLNIDEISADRLYHLIDSALSIREVLRQNIIARYSEVHQQANRWPDFLPIQAKVWMPGDSRRATSR